VLSPFLVRPRPCMVFAITLLANLGPVETLQRCPADIEPQAAETGRRPVPWAGLAGLITYPAVQGLSSFCFVPPCSPCAVSFQIRCWKAMERRCSRHDRLPATGTVSCALGFPAPSWPCCWLAGIVPRLGPWPRPGWAAADRRLDAACCWLAGSTAQVTVSQRTVILVFGWPPGSNQLARFGLMLDLPLPRPTGTSWRLGLAQAFFSGPWTNCWGAACWIWPVAHVVPGAFLHLPGAQPLRP